MTAFYRVVEEQSAQLSAIATAAQGRLLITPVPNSPIESVVRQSVYISPEQGEKDVDLSLAEINLRQILLKKQKSKATATERCDVSFLNFVYKHSYHNYSNFRQTFEKSRLLQLVKTRQIQLNLLAIFSQENPRMSPNLQIVFQRLAITQKVLINQLIVCLSFSRSDSACHI